MIDIASSSDSLKERLSKQMGECSPGKTHEIVGFIAPHSPFHDPSIDFATPTAWAHCMNCEMVDIVELPEFRSTIS